MVLGFKKQFVEPIKAGTKIHTIREDKHNRWKPGRKIHGATGVRTKKYKQFFEDTCKSTQQIGILWRNGDMKMRIDNSIMGYAGMEEVAKNDGFNSLEDFLKWFNKNFTGKIICWTDKRY